LKQATLCSWCHCWIYCACSYLGLCCNLFTDEANTHRAFRRLFGVR